MNKYSKGFTQVFVLIVLVLAVIVGIGYWAYKNGQIKFASQQSVSPTPRQSLSGTTNWKTYIDANFFIKLPPNTNSFLCDESSCWSKSTKLPSGAKLVFIPGGEGSTHFPNKTLTLLRQAWKKTTFPSQKLHWETCSS